MRGALQPFRKSRRGLGTLARSIAWNATAISRAAARADNLEHFLKNISIVGGFLLLYVAGPGRYALDTVVGHTKLIQAR